MRVCLGVITADGVSQGVMLCVGYASANWVGYGFFFVKNGGIAWRLPLGIGGVPPLVLAIFCPILPQSPRWLIGKGRTAEARVVCQRLLRRPKSNEADQDKLWQVEFSQMVEQHEHYAEMPSSWRSLFTLPHYRRRALIGFFTMFFVQCSGMLVITSESNTLPNSLPLASSEIDALSTVSHSSTD